MYVKLHFLRMGFFYTQNLKWFFYNKMGFFVSCEIALFYQQGLGLMIEIYTLIGMWY